MDINSESLINLKRKMEVFILYKIQKKNDYQYFLHLEFYQNFAKKLIRIINGEVPHLIDEKYEQELTRNIIYMAESIFKLPNIDQFIEEFVLFIIQNDPEY